MKINCVWEHNGGDSLLYSSNCIGAYTRGASRKEALDKMQKEVAAYLRWTGAEVPDVFDVEITEEKESDLKICDADSDVIFACEKEPLTIDEYEHLKALALKSAEDFMALYLAVPDKDKTCLDERTTFYGSVPRTAREMYEHTKNVNAYYFGEIGVDADNEGSIVECRKRGFELLEGQKNFLKKGAEEGSYGEMWSLHKVLRRFIWHDRIHAKAMYRMAKNTFGQGAVEDTFSFDL